MNPENGGTNGISAAKLFKEGIFSNNPVLVQMLGMCPALATTSSVSNGLGMGISVVVVLTFSNLLISLLRKLIPEQVRLASYIVIIAGLVSLLEMFLKVYTPDLDKSLGLFVPLIAVNCIILARAETFASKNGAISSALDGLFMGLGFAVALFLLASLREIFSAGTFAGIKVMPDIFPPILIFSLPAGAFILLGCLVAIFKQTIGFFAKKDDTENHGERENQ